MLAKRFKILDRWQITQRNRVLHCLLNSDCITKSKTYQLSYDYKLTWEKRAFHNLRISQYILYNCLIFLSLRNNENEYWTFSNREHFEQCFGNSFAKNQKHFSMNTFLFQFTDNKNARNSRNVGEFFFYLKQIGKNN